MNDTKQKLRLPIHLLVLDAIGAVMIGIGMADWVADTNLVPDKLQFDNYYIVMIVAGVLLMLPAITYFLKFASSQQTRKI